MQLVLLNRDNNISLFLHYKYYKFSELLNDGDVVEKLVNASRKIIPFKCAKIYNLRLSTSCVNFFDFFNCCKNIGLNLVKER